jgi:hypothetical protein
MKKIEITEALISLAPGAWWTIDGNPIYENIQWLSLDYPKPTKKQVLDETARLQAEWDNKEYQRLRAKEYPPVTDYLDAVVKGDLAQQQTYIDACLAVKAKYPKPEEI